MAIRGLDHLVYASPDLQQAIEAVRALTGVEPVRGGSHAGRGTRNALLSLGAYSYIEILAPDPAQSAEARARSADRIPGTPRLIEWATILSGQWKMGASGGLDLGADRGYVTNTSYGRANCLAADSRDRARRRSCSLSD
jgi:hypothetical protein